MTAASGAPRRVGTIWVFDLSWPAVETSPRVAATFSRSSPQDLLAGLDAGDGELDPTEAASRFEAGRRCYTAWVGDRLAAYGWVSFREEYIGELKLRVHLQPCEAYIWDCFTFPAYRQQRLYSALLGFILKELRDESVCRAWIGADFDNAPSQRGIDRAGFRRVADLELSRVPGLQLFSAKGYPGVPGRLVSEAARVFLGSRRKLLRPAFYKR